jgi:hypothetical protein
MVVKDLWRPYPALGTRHGSSSEPTAVALAMADVQNRVDMRGTAATPAIETDQLIPPAGLVLRGVRRAQVLVSGAIAVFLGVLPHVLHHAGPLAGAALFAGVGGSVLFGAIGLVAAIPFLLRVRRRCGNWLLPGTLLVTFAAIFSISTFVVGPAIAGGGDDDGGASSGQSAKPASTNDASPKESGHAGHH